MHVPIHNIEIVQRIAGDCANCGKPFDTRLFRITIDEYKLRDGKILHTHSTDVNLCIQCVDSASGYISIGDNWREPHAQA